VAGYEYDALRLLGVTSAEHRIYIGDFGRLRDAIGGLLGETVGFHLQAAAAFFGVALKLRLDPLPRRSDSLARFDGCLVLRGNRGPVLEADQLLDRLPNAVRRNLPDRLGDVRVDVRVGCQAGRRTLTLRHFLRRAQRPAKRQRQGNRRGCNQTY